MLWGNKVKVEWERDGDERGLFEIRGLVKRLLGGRLEGSEREKCYGIVWEESVLVGGKKWKNLGGDEFGRKKVRMFGVEWVVRREVEKGVGDGGRS